MKNRFLKVGRKRKLLLISIGLLASLVLLISFLTRSTISQFFYKNPRVMAALGGAASESGHQPQILNFDFSLRDMEYFNSFPALPAFEGGKRQTVGLNFNNENHTVDLMPFKNYFKKIKMHKAHHAFSVDFPVGLLGKDLRSFDLFKMKRPNYFNQQSIYLLARRLGLLFPYTDYVNVYINYLDYGDYTLKQSFDHLFLERINMPDAIIVMVERSSTGRLSIRYLYSEVRNQVIEEHLERFPQLLEAKDPFLLVKYFDLDYMARFSALANLLQANGSFMLHNNLKFVYNNMTGKLYPLLDESNIDNMFAEKKNKTFKFLLQQMDNSRAIKQKRKRALYRLSKEWEDIREAHLHLEKSFNKLSNNIFYRFRLALVSAYFNTNIFHNLKHYEPKGLVQAQKPDSESRTIKLTGIGAAVKKGKTYLDHMLLSPQEFLENTSELDLQLDEAGGKMVLAPGDYTLSRTITVPIGSLLEIPAGTTLRLAPGVSFVSYSPVHILGTRERPVTIRANDYLRPFHVVAIIGSSSGSRAAADSDRKLCKIEYLDFSGGSRAIMDGVKHTGGLNIYNCDTRIRHSSFHHNRENSGLSIKDSVVMLEDNLFYKNYSDQLTLDFCRGVVRNNRIYDSGEDNNGDGAAVKGSEILFTGNQFSNIKDKGASIGKHSKVIFYGNRFTGTNAGIAARDRGEMLLLNNVFKDNRIATTAYMRRQTLGGGSIYLGENTFINNKRKSEVDKFSRYYRIRNPAHLQRLKDVVKQPDLNDKGISDLFLTFAGIRQQFRYQPNRVNHFSIGKTAAIIDEANKIIFAALPPGSAVTQSIQFSILLPGARVNLTPVTYGSRAVEPAEENEKELINKKNYNFKEFIFRGQLNIQHDFQVDAYELIVTSGNVPIIEIESVDRTGKYNKIKNEPKIPCKIRFFWPSENDSPVEKRHMGRFMEARIEGRGQRWEKWKYGLTLEKRIQPGGMIASKRWVLESCYVEKSLMRPKISFDLFDRFRNPSWKRISPQSRFVEVILNGDYRGVYLLMEHVDSDFLGLEDFDKHEPQNALLFRAKNRNANFSRYNHSSFLLRRGYEDFPGGIQPLDKDRDQVYGWSSGFQQRHPSPDKVGEHWKPLKEFCKFVALSLDEDFEREIFDKLDIDRYINFMIFMQLLDDSDGRFQNRYLARDKGIGSKWYFVPWDKDGVFGRDFKKSKRSSGSWLRTGLFDRCLKIQWFRDAFQNTWNDLLARGIIAEESIYKMIDENALLLADAQLRNFKRWPHTVSEGDYPDNNTFHQEITYMKSWIKSRILFLYNTILRIHQIENPKKP